MNKSQLSEIITNIVKRKLAEHKIGLNELENMLTQMKFPTQKPSAEDLKLKKSQSELAKAETDKAKHLAKIAKLDATTRTPKQREELRVKSAEEKIGAAQEKVERNARDAQKKAKSTGQISTTQLKEVDTPAKTYKWKDGTAIPVNYQSEPIEQGWQSLGYANGWSSNPEDKQKYDQNKNKMWYTARLNTDGTQKAIYCPEAKLWYLVDSIG